MSGVSAPTASLRLAPSQVKWTEAHEKTLSKDHPFTEIEHETPEMYVQRTYLQALWLPEVRYISCILLPLFTRLQSISPLSLLIPALLRVNVASSSTGPHPLHALIEHVLLSGRSASDKYRVELPQVIADGGGAGEIEETMMWYALSYEKNEVETQARPGTNEYTEAILSDEKWRANWFERMERRE